MTSYQLEKFESGPVYFLKVFDQNASLTSIEAIINILEIREEAEYNLNIIICKNYNTHNISIHGSYLNPQSLIQIITNILNENPNIYDNIVRTTELV
jgi:hypothetical protein